MRRFSVVVALFGAVLLSPRSGHGEKPAAVPAAKLATPAAYYATYADLKDKVRVSDEMAAKLVEIIGRKARPFHRTLTAAPRGYFVVGGKTYCLYGAITSDPQQGDAWDDSVLHRFWDELNRVNDELAPLRHFKP